MVLKLPSPAALLLLSRASSSGLAPGSVPEGAVGTLPVPLPSSAPVGPAVEGFSGSSSAQPPALAAGVPVTKMSHRTRSLGVARVTYWPVALQSTSSAVLGVRSTFCGGGGAEGGEAGLERQGEAGRADRVCALWQRRGTACTAQPY